VAGNGANIAGSLLVIAGAGSGKTNTLAHRVAHLIVNGTDPVGELEAAYHQRKGAHLLRHHLSGERVGRGHPRPHAGESSRPPPMTAGWPTSSVIRETCWSHSRQSS